MGGTSSSSATTDANTTADKKQQQQSIPTPLIFTRVAFIANIVSFADAPSLVELVQLSHVNRHFRETVLDYSSDLYARIGANALLEPGFACVVLNAARYDDLAWTLSRLLAYSALDPTALLCGRKSIIFVAVKNRAKRVLEAIFESHSIIDNPDVRSRTLEHWGTPLEMAIESGDEEVVQLLLDAGCVASVEAMLKCARASSGIAMLKLLCASENARNARLKQRWEEVVVANSDEEFFARNVYKQQSAVEKWADLMEEEEGDKKQGRNNISSNKTTRPRRTARPIVHELASCNHAAELERCVNVGGLDVTPLSFQHPSYIRIGQRREGHQFLDTALHIACRTHNGRVVRLLIEMGCPIRARNCIGDTALWIAMEHSLQESSSALAEADVKESNININNALQLATSLHPLKHTTVIHVAARSAAALLQQVLEQQRGKKVVDVWDACNDSDVSGIYTMILESIPAFFLLPKETRAKLDDGDDDDDDQQQQPHPLSTSYWSTVSRLPIHAACEVSGLENVRLLLAAPGGKETANVPVRGRRFDKIPEIKITPAVIAAFRGSADILGLLFDAVPEEELNFEMLKSIARQRNHQPVAEFIEDWQIGLIARLRRLKE